MSNDIQTTFQSRLSSKLNKLSQKLNDNSVRLSGVASDCIKISVTLSPQGDIIKRKVEEIDVVPVIFPPLIDVPLRIVKSITGETIVIPYTFDIQPVEVLIPLKHNLDQDDLLIKFYENTEGVDPYIAIYQVKEILGSFGARSIIYHKYKLTNFDGTLPNQILLWVMDMAERRNLLSW